MKIGFFTFLFLCWFTALNCCLFAQSAKHIVLISIDGLRPEMYQNASWPAPHLRQLMKEGVYADHMKSVFPSYTYPSHVAMLTGALPTRSGIYYNAPMGSKGDWNWFTKDIKVLTLWQALKQKGLTTSAVEWPVSVSPDITYNIPEIWSNDHPEDRITEVRKYATPGLIEEIERNATGKLDSVNMNEEYSGLDINAARIAAYIFITYKPNLLALHFAGVDGRQHEYGTEATQVKLAVENVDHSIGVLLEAIERSGMKDSTTVIIVGDHGFANYNSFIQPNVWIKELKAKFQPAGGSCFLYLDDKKDASTFKQVKRILDTVSARKYFRVIEKKELDAMGVDSSAMLALAAEPGYIFGGSSNGPAFGKTKSPGGHHGYDPNIKEMYTGFIAAGAGINKGRKINELCVTDIAPLIAKLLGVEFTSPDGKLVPRILNE